MDLGRCVDQGEQGLGFEYGYGQNGDNGGKDGWGSSAVDSAGQTSGMDTDIFNFDFGSEGVQVEQQSKWTEQTGEEWDEGMRRLLEDLEGQVGGSQEGQASGEVPGLTGWESTMSWEGIEVAV